MTLGDYMTARGLWLRISARALAPPSSSEDLNRRAQVFFFTCSEIKARAPARSTQPIERERGRELQLKLDLSRELELERKLQLELTL